RRPVPVGRHDAVDQGGAVRPARQMRSGERHRALRNPPAGLRDASRWHRAATAHVLPRHRGAAGRRRAGEPRRTVRRGRAELIAQRLRDLVGDDGVVDQPAALKVYECDGYTLERASPELVVLPRTPEAVAAVVRVLATE